MADEALRRGLDEASAERDQPLGEHRGAGQDDLDRGLVERGQRPIMLAAQPPAAIQVRTRLVVRVPGEVLDRHGAGRLVVAGGGQIRLEGGHVDRSCLAHAHATAGSRPDFRADAAFLSA